MIGKMIKRIVTFGRRHPKIWGSFGWFLVAAWIIVAYLWWQKLSG